MDALRLVAALGLVLWMIPVLWPSVETAEVTPLPMSRALFYIFGVWSVLIALSAALALTLRDRGSAARDKTPETDTLG